MTTEAGCALLQCDIRVKFFLNHLDYLAGEILRVIVVLALYPLFQRLNEFFVKIIFHGTGVMDLSQGFQKMVGERVLRDDGVFPENRIGCWKRSRLKQVRAS